MAAVALAMFASVSMVGCAADRTAEAVELRPAIQAMPGVTSADVSYVNDFENGANLDIQLDMSQASIEEIRAAAKKINDLKGSRFDDHRQTTKISVDDHAELEYGGYGGALEAKQIAADSVAVRTLDDQVNTDTIRWVHFEDFSSLELQESTSPDSDLRAVVSALPASSTLVSVRSGAPDPHNSWDVALPLTLEQVNNIVGLRDGLPVTVYQVEVRDGHVSGLDVNLGDPAGADERVRAVVTAVAPSRAHPVTVEWRLAVNAPREIGRFTACSAGAASSTAPPAPAFAALENQFAQEFSGCDT